jgi:DNA-binding CsgD family transcriptional regulator
VEILLFLTISVNLVLFAALAIWAVRYAVREELPRIKPLAWGVAVVTIAFVLGAVTRLLLVGVRLGWLDGRVSDFVLGDWHLIQSLVATALGLTGLVVARRMGGQLRQADRIAAAASDRLPDETDFDAMGLTPREFEVLEVVAGGKLSDIEIADQLFISPATAGTHIKNILRKAGVSSRRDLALLAASRRR